MNTLKKIISIAIFAIFCNKGAVAQHSEIKQQIVITNFTIYEKDAKLIFNWSTDGSIATNFWKLQKSFDAKEYATIAIIMGNDPNQQGDNYSFKQKIKTEVDLKCFYRLCHQDGNGVEQISNITKPVK